MEAQLSSKVSKGIIEKVPMGESLTWYHPMVVVPKKSSAVPLITVDPLTGLNKYVERPAYPTGVPGEVVASVPPGVTYISSRWTRITGTGRFPLSKPVLSLRLSSSPAVPIIFYVMS